MKCVVAGCNRSGTIKSEATIISDDKQKVFKKTVYVCYKHYKEIKRDMSKISKVS